MASAAIDLPFGCRFRPTHEDLLYILRCKVSGTPFFCNGAVTEADVYNHEQLQYIFKHCQNKRKEVLYFFTKLKKKGGKGTKRIDRSVGNGTWKAQQKSDLKFGGGWRSFSYENRESIEHKIWTMVEYFLADNNDYVLCQIKKHDRDKKKGVINEPEPILPDQLVIEYIYRDMQPDPILTDQMVIENAVNIYRNVDDEQIQGNMEGQCMSNAYGELLDLANNDYMQPRDQLMIEMDPNLSFDLDELLDIVNNDQDIPMIETGPNLWFEPDELLDMIDDIGEGKEIVAIEDNLQPDQIFKHQQMIQAYDELKENQSITKLESVQQCVLDDFDQWLAEKE